MRPLLHLARVDDADYFRARALQEQVAAQTATSAVARERHDELAMHYRFRSMMLSDPCLAPEVCLEAATEVTSWLGRSRSPG